MPFTFKRLTLPEIIQVELIAFHDKRGFFLETYKYSDFAQNGITGYFVQDHISRSVRNVLRGLHYQKEPKGQDKLVRCGKGEVFDVVVDIRKGSPNYGKWMGILLSEKNNLMIYVPVGFAHGFVVLSEFADMIYKCTQEYSVENDRGIIWNDQTINIDWPIKDPIISEKDLKNPTLEYADNNFSYD